VLLCACSDHGCRYKLQRKPQFLHGEGGLSERSRERKSRYAGCVDDYTESIDMPTALHPQTILATRYAKELITDPFLDHR